MKVILPERVAGVDIAKAIEKAAERTGFSCELNTENDFTAGSVKEIPLGHTPELEKRTGRFWGKTGLVIGQFENNTLYASIEISCKVPFWDIYGTRVFVSKTNDEYFSKAEPYFKEFVGAFLEELQKAESTSV